MLKGYNTDVWVGESGEKAFSVNLLSLNPSAWGRRSIESGDCAGIVHGFP